MTEQQIKILVAEDDALNQRLIEMLLSKLGCRVTLADNGKKAVEAFKQDEFALVLMDLEMPVMNGQEAVRQIRELEQEKQISDAIPVYAMTGHDEDDELLQQCTKAGMNGYLSKPLSVDKLRQVMNGILP